MGTESGSGGGAAFAVQGVRTALRRYEATYAGRCQSPVLVGVSGAGHAAWASFVVNVSGGPLPAPHDELVRRILVEGPAQLARSEEAPETSIRRFVAWLEHERQHGFLTPRARVTASIVMVESAHDVWTWLVSPHGVLRGTVGAMQLEGVDQRYPAERGRGAMESRSRPFGRIELVDRLSAAGRIGAPATYETRRVRLSDDELVACFDRTGLPFGPWPSEPEPLASAWSRDAGWRHGLGNSHVLLVGHVDAAPLQLPSGWQLREVPFGRVSGA